MCIKRDFGQQLGDYGFTGWKKNRRRLKTSAGFRLLDIALDRNI